MTGWAQETSLEARWWPWAFAATLSSVGRLDGSQEPLSAPKPLSNFLIPGPRDRKGRMEGKGSGPGLPPAVSPWRGRLPACVQCLSLCLHYPLALINQEEKSVPKRTPFPPSCIFHTHTAHCAPLRIKLRSLNSSHLCQGPCSKPAFPAKQGQ